MDYRDYQAGVPGDFFWFKAKRQLISILLGKLDTGGSSRILNVGAGTGEDISVIKKAGEIYVIDIEPQALEMVPEGLTVEKRLGDVCQIPYADEFFDMVLAFDVLEHVENDAAAVKEIIRVLKPGGAFVFTVPAFNFLYSSHDRALSHFRRYNKATLRALLRDLTCVELSYWVFSLFLPVALQRLMKRREPVPKVHYMNLPGALNTAFYRLLNIENFLIKHRVPLPLGTAIYGIYRADKGKK